MPSFTYTAIDVAGKQVSGNLVVRNKSEAYRELESKTLTPITVFPSGEEAPTRASRKAAQEAGSAKLKRPELVLFTEELADLLDAGMQLERALKILHERQANKSIKAVSGILRDEIREGARFSKALAKASPSFDELYRSLVAAGEASGSLPEILRRLVVNLKQLFDLQRRTMGAMIYPITVMLACVVLLFVFSTVLMPSLSEMMQKTGQDLPMITDLLIKFTDFMGAWWWLILGILVGSFVLFRLHISTAKGREWWDGYKMKIPAFGPVIILSLFWSKTTYKGAIAGMLTGTIVTFIWRSVPFLKAWLYELIPAFLFALIATYFVSTITFNNSKVLQEKNNV